MAQCRKFKFISRIWQLYLTSIALQVILTVFGSFRKRCSKKWLTFLLWSAYQLADVVATTGLGMITSFVAGDLMSSKSRCIMSSFLLWHLGGPDSISAFSLVDNELYFRHLIQLVYIVGVAGYTQLQILFLVGIDINEDDQIYDDEDYFETYIDSVRYLIAPLMILFLAGMSKYGERTWALHSANMTILRDSMLPPPNPGWEKPLKLNDDGDDHNNVPMDEYDYGTMTPPTPTEKILLEEQLDSDKAILLHGHHYFCSFKRLFVDLMVPYSHIVASKRFFLQNQSVVAFQLIDVEIRFVYDRFFTKALVVRTWLAFTLRLLRFSALICYFVLIFPDLYGYNKFSAWALVQEMYEVIQMLLSEWTVVWLNNHGFDRLSTIILKLILSCRWLVFKIIPFFCCGVKVVASEKTTIWWYNNIMAQYNLLNVCFKDEPTMFRRILHISSFGKSIHEWAKRSWNTTYMYIPHDIKDFILQQFKEMILTSDEEIRSAEFRNSKGKWVMKRNNYGENNCLEELSWSVDVEFDQSILIWHVATDLCYYYDEAATVQVQVSKALSNYLLYLLLIFPFMINSKIGKIMFQDTYVAIKEVFDVLKDKRQKKSKPFSFILRGRKSSLDEKQAKAYIMRFLQLDTQVLIRKTKSDESKSVLFEAHKLANLLQLYDKEKRWKIISGVWVEMLSYAANNCTGKHHAQRLCDGGEFLTKIWLLMAHLGMLE